MTVTTAKWTLEEYHRLIEEGFLDEKRVELLNGEIIEMSPEGTPHAYLSSAGADYLRKLLGDRAQVREDKPITLPNNSEPEPDIAIVQLLGDEYFQHHPYPENIFWLIEFSDSSLSKDLEIKSKLYGAAGIPEYWVINLKARTLIVFRSPAHDGYGSEQSLNQGVIHPIAFQDVQVEVQRLLRSSLRK